MNLFDQLDEKENGKFDCSYTWSDMANFMTNCGIPHSVLANLVDPFVAMIVYKRPVFDVLKFDDYVHEKYGDYEKRGKSLKDMFKEIFGDKIKEAEYYFGITK